MTYPIPNPSDPLTSLELDVVTLLAHGEQTKGISKATGYSPWYILQINRTIRAKLECSNNCHAVFFATKLGLIGNPSIIKPRFISKGGIHHAP
jgi:DNA-binding NarL/FixJ family response regulator